MKDVRVVVQVIKLLQTLCWVCLFAFIGQIVNQCGPLIAQSVQPQFITHYDSTTFDHTKIKHRHVTERSDEE